MNTFCMALRKKIKRWFEEDEYLNEASIDAIKKIFIDSLKSKKSFKLYKYVSADYFSIRNFENSNIFLAINSNLNDVFEGVPVFEGECSKVSNNDVFSLAITSSFCEEFDNPLMWAHYADSSRGFCIEYDLKKLPEEWFEDYCLLPVIYQENRITYSDTDLLIDSIKNIKNAMINQIEYDDGLELDCLLPLLMVKGIDWKYEKEWRVIETIKNHYDNYCMSFNGKTISFPCATAIYIGAKMEKVYEEHLKEISAKKGIYVYKAKLSKNEFKFEFINEKNGCD